MLYFAHLAIENHKSLKYLNKKISNADSWQFVEFANAVEQLSIFLDCFGDSLKSPRNDENGKFALDSQSIRATNRNRSNGGVAFVFVENFGIKLD